MKKIIAFVVYLILAVAGMAFGQFVLRLENPVYLMCYGYFALSLAFSVQKLINES